MPTRFGSAPRGYRPARAERGRLNHGGDRPKERRNRRLRSGYRSARIAAAEGASTDADVHSAAAHGTSGAATTLPQLATIQQLFGRHDVSGVQAHVGGAAAEGARAMGAQAFATGDHAAFAETPDLHTAAH